MEFAKCMYDIETTLQYYVSQFFCQLLRVSVGDADLRLGKFRLRLLVVEPDPTLIELPVHD